MLYGGGVRIAAARFRHAPAGGRNEHWEKIRNLQACSHRGHRFTEQELGLLVLSYNAEFCCKALYLTAAEFLTIGADPVIVMA